MGTLREGRREVGEWAEFAVQRRSLLQTDDSVLEASPVVQKLLAAESTEGSEHLPGDLSGERVGSFDLHFTAGDAGFAAVHE